MQSRPGSRRSVHRFRKKAVRIVVAFQPSYKLEQSENLEIEEPRELKKVKFRRERERERERAEEL